MITRAHMRRQLYRSGGITNARQGYGLGSWVKEKIRKIIPNELADIATKAAPFVAPFNPLAAGLMRGVGRFDKRGSISDALKQGLLTYGGGQAARYLGGAGMQQGFGGGQLTSPMGPNNLVSRMYEGVRPTAKTPSGAWDTGKWGPQVDKVAGGADQTFLNKVMFGKERGTGMFGDKGLIGAKGEFDLGQSFGKGVPAVFAGSTLASLAVQAAAGDIGGRKPGESLTAFNTRRKGTVGKYLDEYFRKANKFRIAPENMDKAAADFVAKNTVEYNQGGRVGYAIGSPEKQMEAGAPPIIYEGNMDPRAQNQQAGLPSIPGPVQMAEDGPEYDMSERGGFQPLGAQEGKDDVKANLAKNEFVFTADAVRAAGGGSIQQGAQKMYDTMKKLESRVA